jgi:hypothetical protein
MPFNFSGNSLAINACNQLSLHSTNPGTGAAPAGGSELSTSPYVRQNCTFAAPVANGTAAESNLSGDATFSLSPDTAQNVQFIGLWNGSTYLGYLVPNNPFNFTGAATSRQFIVTATGTKLVRDNQ